MIETFASLVTIIGGGVAVLKYFKRKQRNEARKLSFYLSGAVATGEGVANRIIALFDAHDVKQTQVYRLLGDRFPEITPSLDAQKLEALLSEALIDRICELFGVRKTWLEGEDGPIYEPLSHHKDLPAFVEFAHELKGRNCENFCILTAVKELGTSDDLYAGSPDIALFISEPIADIGRKTIYRYYPLYGPFPWRHKTTRYHLYAFFKVASELHLFPLKGYSASLKEINKISAGEVIPTRNLSYKQYWHPDDYAYPEGQFNGRAMPGDWEGMLEYFDGDDVDGLLTLGDRR